MKKKSLIQLADKYACDNARSLNELYAAKLAYIAGYRAARRQANAEKRKDGAK